MHFKDVTGTYKCDKCRATFDAQEVKLRPAATNVTILTPMSPMLFVNKEGKIMGGGKHADPGDQTLHCPKCGELHLFGFNLA
jgi:hypothetical protein